MPVISPGKYEPPAPSHCAGCGGKIADRYYLLAVDRQWHVRCLKCCECKLTLDSELTCFSRDGNIYCKEDYYRLFAVKRCARCQQGIFANELVMRARDLVYHVHCFTCAWCNTVLTQGDYFGLKDNLVYCRTHYELLVQGEPYLPPDGAPNGTVGDRSGELVQHHYSSYPPVETAKKGVPLIDPRGCNLNIPTLESGTPHQNMPSLQNSQPQRTKRMRTSFKHHQLRTMKSYFAINQNPDAKDLKQLAQKTGLSKRVLQVWFQNARAKWRRNNLKQQDQQSQHHSPQHQHSISVSSPGATSSFSEPSPSASCSMGVESSLVGVPPHIPVSLSGIEYSPNSSLTPIVSHHAMPSGSSSDSFPLSSFQELF
ncbi:LIM/homeobox protein Lhx9-like isoform X2 [Tachypleus tridentatus]|uniref:LIM/homeobox protein Lhx9-like isoform X2 n=1 Tax=Tachypleus tridentatus TaxID=6853 RepID=UPI003FD40273